MIREIIKPKERHITINIPKSYIGKEIEYIVFPLEKENNISQKQTLNKDIKSLRGSLNKYANLSKIESEGGAWKLHVKKKYAIDD